MKKSLLLIFAMAFLVTVVSQAQPIKVGYFTLQKVMSASATKVTNDPIIRMLKADPNFEVTVNVTKNNDTVDLTGYDIVIIQESYGSGDAILKTAGSLGLPKLTMPALINKTYGFRSGRILRAPAANSAAEGNFYLQVDSATHDIFKGVTLSGDSVAMFHATTDDLGAAGSKALNMALGNVLSDTTTLLAFPKRAAANVSICINDIPAGTIIDSDTTKARIITFGNNFGALSANGGQNITDEGLTMWRNAIYSLAGLAVPSTPLTVEKLKIGYFTLNKTMASTAAPVDQDPVIEMLKKDSKFDVVVNVTKNTDTVSLEGYELVIIQESYGSGDAILKTAGSLGLPKLTMPAIINKTYGFRSGRILRAPAANSAGEGGLYLEVRQPSNEIFKGITLSGDSVKVFKSTADDLGAPGTKATNIALGNVLSDTLTLLALPKGAAANTSICLNDIPGGTIIDSDTTLNRIITFGNNMGAICKDKGTNFTSEGLTMWRNAVYSALGLTVPSTALPPAIPELNIILISPATNGDINQYNFLVGNKLNVTQMYPGKLAAASQGLIDTLNMADLIIIGRAGNSGDFGSGDSLTRARWNNNITVPVIENSPWHVRNSRLNWFNSGTAVQNNATTGMTMGYVMNVDDPIFNFATSFTADSIEWSYLADDYLSVYVPINGDTVAYRTINDTTTAPLIVRFKVGSAFYAGSLDTCRAPRTYFGFGNDAAGPRNYFPLTNDIQAAYLGEIMKITGYSPIVPLYYVSADASIKSLTTVPKDTLKPATFSADVMAYTLVMPKTDKDSVVITAAATHSLATVTGNGTFQLSKDTSTFSVYARAENTRKGDTYVITVIRVAKISDINEQDLPANAITVFPNPAKDNVIVSGLSENSTIRILNTAGQLLYQEKTTGERVVIDIQNFKDGVYIIQLEMNGIQISKKFIKQ